MDRNVYRLMLMPAAISFAVSMIMGPVVIPFLRRIKAGQTVRENGPQSHLKKTGTPTMGGIMILAAVVITSLIYRKDYPKILPILFLTLGFGLIGFCDDYVKVVFRRAMGLKPWQKLLGQFVVTGLFVRYLTQSGADLSMRIPFWADHRLDLGVWNVPVLFFIVIGTANGVNLTDGLDGLAGSVTVIVATFFTVAAFGTGSGTEPVICAAVGALLGFLVFNVHPASVFMGDTGSLALGGFVAASAYTMGLQAYLPLVGVVYMAEAASVILQVAYFKASGGKRILRMAPLHHHFELCGWVETRIVTVFSILTAMCCLIALAGL